jgi:Asp-tRNA(Asn)/Glu-tRNA(Gln) amidotransferase A subunit family amidase
MILNVWGADTPETYKDAPVGLQIVARTHEDEALIRMAEIVDQALKAALSGRST